MTTGHSHLPVEDNIKEEHLISDTVLHDPEISKDFRDRDNIINSSPIAERPGSSIQFEESTKMFSTGKEDVRGFPIVAFCKPSQFRVHYPEEDSS